METSYDVSPILRLPKLDKRRDFHATIKLEQQMGSSRVRVGELLCLHHVSEILRKNGYE